MNLQCPSCQKLLTVPEQYAGQLMKCPLCTSTFTVPTLPTGGIAEPAPAFIAPPPAAPPAAPPPLEPAYSFKDDHPATPAFMDPVAPPAAPPPEPAFSTSPPLAPAPAPEPPRVPAPAPEPPRPTVPVTPGDYEKTCRITFDPAVLKWVPLGALVLIFILTFFPWVGVYPGGLPAATQGAWGAAFGSITPDPAFRSVFKIVTEEDSKAAKDPAKEPANAPGFSPLLFFYLLFFLLTLGLVIALAVLPQLKIALPPPVQQFLPWQWAILACLNAVILLFLVLQLLLGFSLESSVTTWANNRPDLQAKKDPSVEEKTLMDVRRATAISAVQRTYTLKFVVFLHVIATLAAGLVLWIDKRGPARPLPIVEMRW